MYMKIRVISDLHLDVNDKFPFSIKQEDRDVFTLIAGDVSGNVKLTARWVKENINNGMFIVGNHDPAYNDIGWTIKNQKLYLHDKFNVQGSNVTYLDESVGVMSKEIPNTNILVVGTTLYTDYRYISEDDKKWFDKRNEALKKDGEPEIDIGVMNRSSGERRLNDFRWGKVEDEIEFGKQRYLRAKDYEKWFNSSFQKIKEIIEANPDKEIIVLTHHCPTPKCISGEYVNSNLNSSYVSDLEDFIKSHTNIKAWCCGHVHSVTIDKVGETLIVCNPRGYERNFESDKWNPNTFIDTDKWEVVTEEWEVPPKLAKKRKEHHSHINDYLAWFI